MQELTRTKKIRSIIAASSGNLVEWFDFYIYAFTATYFAHTFSTSDNPVIQQINAFGVFAAGFFMRPIGSWLFGSLADKVGRKKSMVISVVLMALGSLRKTRFLLIFSVCNPNRWSTFGRCKH